MKVLEQLEWRYATKKFDSDRIIPNKTLDVILNAFNLTATSYGLQPLKLVVLNNKSLQQELVSASMQQEQVGQASHVLVFCIETNIDKSYIENYFSRVKAIRDTPDAVLNPFKNFLIEDFSTKTQSDIEIWATKQAYLAMGNLLTVCALENIDACPMEGFDPKVYDKVLGLDKRKLKSVLIMPIGYRSDNDMFAGFKKVRKPLSESIVKV